MVYLSIIVPVYKTEMYLSRCLDSICLQLDVNSSNVEVWLVNDGSPDNSLEIIKEYCSKYPKIINIINKENGGVSEARNTALDRVSGRYIWFVDSDDTVEEGSIAQLISIIASTSADYILFNAYRVDAENRIIGKFEHCSGQIETELFSFNADEVLNKYNKHMLWLRLFRREFIGSLRFPVGITHEDIHFDLQLLARKPRILSLDGVFYRHFFDNPDSITNTMNPVKYRHVLWIFSDLHEKFSNNNELRPFLKEYVTVAISTLFSRACYLLSTNLSNVNKYYLFKEYTLLIKNLYISLENYSFCITKPRWQKLVYFFIKNGKYYMAFIIAITSVKIKSVYDFFSISRYRIKRMFNVRL
jgi:glycosyltransferase involved in cell wall biosynthesis